MKFQVKALLIITFLSFSSMGVSAQKVANLDVQVSEDKATIYYDLVGLKENQEVEVRVYATIKGFDMRLYRATGDVGKGITGGNSKSIVWNNDEELTSYNKENITFKINVIAKNQPAKEEKSKNKGIFAGISNIFSEKD